MVSGVSGAQVCFAFFSFLNWLLVSVGADGSADQKIPEPLSPNLLG